MYYGYGFSYLIYIVPGLLLALYAQSRISSAYRKNSAIDSGTGLTGAETAKKLMNNNGIFDVSIVPVSGELTDHYNPSNKTLNLSHDVYYGTSVASLSVAAHEVGHAIQDHVDYVPLKIRGALVPAANIGSSLSMVFIILGIVSSFFIKIGIFMFSLAVLFQIITLPVEFDASRRAKQELAKGIMPQDKLKVTKEVLTAAALTYVASTLTAIGELLRLIAIFGNRDSRD